MATIRRARRGGNRPTADEAPTLLLLHGVGADEHDLADLPASSGLRLSWASLRAPFEFEGGGATWFRSRRPQPPDPAELAASVAAIWSWVDTELGQGTPVVPVGFSQGAFMVTRLLASRPERVIAPVVLSGLVLGDASGVGVGSTSVRPPLFWGRGLDDPMIAVDEVERLRAYLTARTDLEEHVYAGLGHGIAREELADAARFIGSTITRSSARPSD